jgi:hypothetical protein
LSDVKAFQGDVLIVKQDIEVSIEKASKNEYRVNYSILAGGEILLSEAASFYVDNEPPVFTGISDRILEPGQIPDRTLALKDVTVTDNYTVLKPEDIKVTIEELQGVYNGPENNTSTDAQPQENDTNTDPVAESDISGSITLPSTGNATYYSVTYEAQDEAGNTTNNTVYFYY